MPGLRPRTPEAYPRRYVEDGRGSATKQARSYLSLQQILGGECRQGAGVRHGELYRVARPSEGEPKRYRVFVVVSRQLLIDSRFSPVVCAPVYSRYEGLSTQVPVEVDQGLKHDSGIHCDELESLPKTMLTHYVGSLSAEKIRQLDTALAIALDIRRRGA